MLWIVHGTRNMKSEHGLTFTCVFIKACAEELQAGGLGLFLRETMNCAFCQLIIVM